ncbi:VCBS repeat-containing protein [Flavimarina sp. Hel_I_48]|uniref:VCBS repeat-containing protein n=1 Tax=Flavimarina sp. Hel_I_48 TaxID=1392488 RepID=UPI001F13E28E|nr:VCBS repeat-containing protein [Flavimarina sp. Hel_I_48]
MIGSLLFMSCEDASLFKEKSTESSGLNFENTLVETSDFNVVTYEYAYNGGGVAVGDLNSDGLPDVYISGNQVSNKLFINKGNLKFEDVTRAAEIKEKKGWKTGTVMADVNGDGLLDIYLSYSGNAPSEGVTTPVIEAYEGRSNQLFINQGNNAYNIPVFKEMSREYGLDAVGTFSTQAYFFDYDLDGDLDMFLLNHANKFQNNLFNVKQLRSKRHPYFGNKLFKNTNNKFTEVSDVSGIMGSGINFGLSASVSDLNKDGYADIFVTNDYSEQDFCYLNQQDGTFKEVSHSAFGHLSKLSMGSDIADVNNDLKPDIFVVDMLPEDNYRQKSLKGADKFNRERMLIDSGYHHQYMRNTLQLNMGLKPDTTLAFSEIAQISGISNTDWSWAPLIADYDNDGRKDIFITNGYLRDYSNLDFNNYTVYEAVEEARKSNKELDLGLLIGKIPSTKIANYAYKNEGNTHFEKATKAWGLDKKQVSNAAAYADFDNDGDLDLLINNLNEPVSLYENTASSDKHLHYIKISLTGSQKNTFALGSKITITLANGEKIYQEAYYGRGYQSSVEPLMTIGLGKTAVIQELEVIWPSMKKTTLKNVNADKVLVLSEKDAQEPYQNSTELQQNLLTAVTEISGLDFKHKENNYVDFYNESLIPYQLSKMGGNASVADVNADGNDDVYFEGAKDQMSQLFLGTDEGRLVLNNEDQPWIAAMDVEKEDAASLFFDADGDGDLDLYVVSGGNEYYDGKVYYQDRLYINDGTGKFSKTEKVLPDMKFSGGTVAAADYDKDGDLDLFVGGRVSGNNYPMTPRSTILKNESKGGVLKFTAQSYPDLDHIGMTTAAIWEDIDHDSWPDLIIVGEWMPITIIKNEKGILKNATQDYGLSHTNGWWLSVVAADIDEDGDTDFLLGNLGLNTEFKASESEPMRYYIQDIDKNGRIDPLLTYYNQGVSYPLPGRDELLGQVPSLKKYFKTYDSYARTTTEELMATASITPVFTLNINKLQSSYLINNGNGTFKIQHLPREVQVSAVQDFIYEDFNGDGSKEVLAAGNLYPFRVNIGKIDASFGALLTFKNDKFITEDSAKKVWLGGDIRDLNVMRFKSGKRRLLVTRNDDKTSLYKINN